MATLITLQTSGINTDGLQLKVLNGKSYLAGPVVMAKETVMNGLLYPADELKRATPGWNGRPVTVGHPKKDGNFVSANSPDVLEKTQIGFIFDTYNKDSDYKQVSNVWLDMSKLDKFPEVRDSVANGAMLEVSTGLFLDKVEEEGTFNGKSYSGKAVNHLPDHLALLPNETGAFSVADGAGFPRVNVMFGTNAVTAYERRRLLRNALAAKLGPDRWFWVADVFDNSMVIEEDNKLFAYDYTFNEDTGALTIGDGVEVFQKIEYPPISTIGLNMGTKPATPAEAPKANTAVPTEPVATPTEQIAPAANATALVTPVVQEPTVNAEVAEALAVFNQLKTDTIATIMGNAANTFTEDELKGLPMASLKKIVALAETAPAKADMTGMGGPGGTMAANKNEETPYVG